MTYYGRLSGLETNKIESRAKELLKFLELPNKHRIINSLRYTLVSFFKNTYKTLFNVFDNIVFKLCTLFNNIRILVVVKKGEFHSQWPSYIIPSY